MEVSAMDLRMVLCMLTDALSAEMNLRKPAEAALAQFETRQGFCSCLMEVIAAKDLSSQTDVRLLASVYLKNCVIRHWRNRRDSPPIGADEKIHLRQKLLMHLGEENYQIALTLSILISKIARVDYPREWSDLFSSLAQKLQSADVLTSHRIFMVLFRTLKELSSKRLTHDQKVFAEIASQFFDYSWQLWQIDVQNILHGFSVLAQNAPGFHQDDAILTCERWVLCSKIIRQLIISGFPSDAKSVQEVLPVKKVCPSMLIAVQSFLQYYGSFQDTHPKFWEFLKQGCTKLMKILIAIQQKHPYSFGDQCVLQPAMEFCLNRLINPEPELLSFEELLIQCMSLVKAILECKEYKPSIVGRIMDNKQVTVQEMKKNASSSVAGILASLLPNERVVLLCNILVRRYFVLTVTDVEDWFQNAESFYHEQDFLLWSERLRPCAEALYIVLFENHSQLLGPVVVSILKEAMSACPSSATDLGPQMLLKDAVYSAAAYVYYELSNYLNFGDWFNGALSTELMNNHVNMRIIHRKVALILGQWISEIKEDMRRPVYCALVRLLQEDDLCVRLTAARSLYFHLEDASFLEQEFSDLVPACWEACFKLAEDAQEFDSKVQAINTISALINRTSEIVPYAIKLVQFFQKAWDESSGESLLQIQLLVALKNLVVALGYQSSICYGMLLPILQSLLNINSPDELLEDSMQLWEATISHASSITPQLLCLFTCLVEILERSLDHLEVAASIIEGYVILGGTEFLNIQGPTLAKVIELVVFNANDKGLLSILPIVDMLVQCVPAELPQLIGNIVPKLIFICLDGGDDRYPSKTALKTAVAAILARIWVMNTNFLAQLTSDPLLLRNFHTAGILTDENILLCLVDVWLDKVDNATSLHKKIFGHALSIILKLTMPQMLERLDQILGVCTSTILGGNEDSTEEESSPDSMQSSKMEIPSKEYRRRQIKFLDPINHISLENSLRESLDTCARLHGESFNAAMSQMHPAALAQLKQALNMA